MKRNALAIASVAFVAACAEQQVFRVQGHAVLQEDPDSVGAYAKNLYPASIASTRYREGPKKKLLVRVYAEEEYRKQTLE